jgi:hypothetical protein
MNTPKLYVESTMFNFYFFESLVLGTIIKVEGSSSALLFTGIVVSGVDALVGLVCVVLSEEQRWMH